MQGAQYLKLGKALHHFRIHHGDNGTSITGFFAFLEEHYADEIDLKNNSEHKNLPFKTMLPMGIYLTLNTISIQPVLVAKKSNYSEKVFFCEPTFLNSSTLFSIWNPPRRV